MKVLAGMMMFVMVVVVQAWEWEARPVPHAYLVEGLWTDHVRVREAVHVAGFPYDAAYKSRSAYFRPKDHLITMPREAAAFVPYSVIVLSNIDVVSLGDDRLAILESFVREGGGLVVLGGYWAFARGGYSGSVLADMLPVSMPEERRIPPAYGGLPLQPGPAADWEMPVSFAEQPAAFFVQTLVPKPEAAVQLLAGDKPALISGVYGKGRVVACAITAHGRAPEGVLPYWEWADWPRLLGIAMEWAAGARPDGLPPGEATRGEPLPVEDLLAAELESASLTPAMVERARQQVTAESAPVLLRLSLADGTRGACPLPQIEPQLRPHATAEWAALLAPVVDAFNADQGQRSAAIRLLGATGDPAAYDQLVKFTQDDAVQTAALEALGLLGDQRAIPLLKSRYEDALQAARSEAFPDDLDPERFARDQAGVAAAAALSLYRLGDPNGVDRLLDIQAMISFYHRVFRNAGKRRVQGTDAQGAAKKRAIHNQARDLNSILKHLHEEVSPLPASQHSAIVEAGLVAREPQQIRFLAWIVEQNYQRLEPAQLKRLQTAPDGILRRLGSIE